MSQTERAVGNYSENPQGADTGIAVTIPDLAASYIFWSLYHFIASGEAGTEVSRWFNEVYGPAMQPVWTRMDKQFSSEAGLDK